MKAKSKILLVGATIIAGATFWLISANRHPDCIGLTIEGCQALTKDKEIEPCPIYYIETMGKKANTVAYVQLVASNSAYITYRGFYVSKDTKKIVSTTFFQDWMISHM